jgi:rubredoxin
MSIVLLIPECGHMFSENKPDIVQPVAGGDQTRWRSPGTTALTLAK